MAEAGLRLENLCIATGGQVLLELDLLVRPGEVVTVMGPSGSGKSTLLSVITGAAAPAFRVTGRILLNGQDITRLRPEARHVGILFQDPLLFPHLSVGANLAFGLSSNVKGRQARRNRIAAALRDVGLEGFAKRDPATLSGGQKARAALLRVLLSDPKALLLDEPFSGLDADRRAQVRQLVFERTHDLPVLLVTHDQDDADAAGGRVVRL